MTIDFIKNTLFRNSATGFETSFWKIIDKATGGDGIVTYMNKSDKIKSAKKTY